MPFELGGAMAVACWGGAWTLALALMAIALRRTTPPEVWRAEAPTVGFRPVPRSRRTSALGHVPTFGTPLRHVWKAAITRHSAPNVGNVLDNLPPMNGRMLVGAA